MNERKQEVRDLRSNVNNKVEEAVRAAEEGNLELALQLQEEIKALGEELKAKEAELEQLEEIKSLEKVEVEKEEEAAAVEERAVEVEEEKEVEQKRSLNKGEEKDMANLNELLNNNEGAEQRSALNAYIRTKGMETRGITSVEAGAVIPEDVITKPQEAPQSALELKKYVNVLPVNSQSGSYPILGAQDAVMNTVAELAKNPDLANPNFTQVDYKVETFRGALGVSQEALDDAAIDLSALIAKDIQKQATSTENARIAAVLKTFAKKAITDLDGLKAIVNVDIDPAYDVKFFVSQSFFNAVDTMKDANGRYILSQDVTVASGAKLFGREVVILADKVIGTKAGDMVAFAGDVKQAVAFFDRKQVSVKWLDHAVYGQYLASMLRFDVKQVDAKAGFYVTLTPAPAA